MERLGEHSEMFEAIHHHCLRIFFDVYMDMVRKQCVINFIIYFKSFQKKKIKEKRKKSEKTTKKYVHLIFTANYFPFGVLSTDTL
jgi:hypothetical protein